MALYVRLIRGFWIFGVIFTSYMIQLGLARVFRRYEKDDTGKERRADPAWLVRRRQRVDERNAKRLVHGILTMRGGMIKLGQVLSILGGFLPRPYTKALEPLQDRVPPRPFSELEPTFIATLGRRASELYREIEREPIAAASLGQVHLAYLKDGRKVAVKVLYPGIRALIDVDMKIIRVAMRVYAWFFPWGSIHRVYDGIVDLLARETDYVNEAACMKRMADNFRESSDVLIPEVVPELSTRDILTMTFMDGVKISNLEELDRIGVNRSAVATRFVQVFYEQLFVHRFFHADPHPGNFLVQAGPTPDEPRLVILDFGTITEARAQLIDGMVDVLQGFFLEDPAMALDGFRRMGFVAKEGNRELLEQTAMIYFRKLLAVKDLSAGALMRASPKDLEKLIDPEVARQRLRELMKAFDYPDGWFYIERASVMFFLLVGQIDPEVDSLQVGFPYVAPLILKRQQELTADLPG